MHCKRDAMTTSPSLVRSISASGTVRIRWVIRWWIGIWGSWRDARPSTVRPVAFDLKTFFTVIVKRPVLE